MEPRSSDIVGNLGDQDTYSALSDELIRLHLQWATFKKLFFTTQEQVELISSSAGYFFGQLYGLLIDAVLLGISRLTDDPRTMRRNNLVLETLIVDLESDGSEFRQNLVLLLEKAKELSRSVRFWRNRLIAHNDHETFKAVAPPNEISVTFAQIEEMLKLMSEFLNYYSMVFSKETVYYEGIEPESTGKLLYALRKAAEFDALVEEGLIPRDHMRETQANRELDEKSFYFPGPRQVESKS